MKVNQISYFNPLSHKFTAANDFKKLSVPDKVITLVLSVLAGIPTLGLGGVAVFRKLTERFVKKIEPESSMKPTQIFKNNIGLRQKEHVTPPERKLSTEDFALKISLADTQSQIESIMIDAWRLTGKGNVLPTELELFQFANRTYDAIQDNDTLTSDEKARSLKNLRQVTNEPNLITLVLFHAKTKKEVRAIVTDLRAPYDLFNNQSKWTLEDKVDQIKTFIDQSHFSDSVKIAAAVHLDWLGL